MSLQVWLDWEWFAGLYGLGALLILSSVHLMILAAVHEEFFPTI